MAVETTRAVTVNGRSHPLPDGEPRTLLAYLRGDLGLRGAKPGCGEGACGACTVWLDGQPVLACQVPLQDAAGGRVTTIEGLSSPDQPDPTRLHPVQRAFVEAGAMQCGYCIPGQVMRAAALLQANPAPGEGDIREAMAPNLCRCCTYPRILQAVRRAAELTAAGPDADAPGLPMPLDGAQMYEEVGTRRAPWDLTPADRRDTFEVLGDGVLALLPPAAESGGRGDGGAWLHVGASGTVTVFTGKADVGQDTSTALALLAAEELSVPLSTVRVVMGDTDLCPYDMGTFGSRSMPDIGPKTRAVAAAARREIIAIAASQWGVEAATIVAAQGRLRSLDGRHDVPFHALLPRVRRTVSCDPPTPMGAKDWATAGRPARPAAAVSVVRGTRRYTTDITAPDMLHGKVLRAPAYGAKLRSVDTSAARAIAGVTVVEEDGFVAVAAPDPATAGRALAEIRTKWDTSPQPGEDEIEAHLRAHPSENRGWGGASTTDAGDVDAALSTAAHRLDATYFTAYIAHAPLETRAALAEWHGRRLTVYTTSQRPFGVRQEVADALGMPPADVRVVVPPTGSGFGGRHPGAAAVEAARLARATGRAVRVGWTREEEFTCGYFRPAAVIDVIAGLDADGAMTAWSFRNINSGTAGIGCPYQVPNRRIAFTPAASPLPQGSYRALAATANAFARESHIDELAAIAKVDPLAFRLRHLADDRLAAVLRAAAERGGWDRPLPDGHGRGIACGVEKNGRVATWAEVEVAADGRLRVLRLVTAFECGAVVNPEGLTNQVQGAVAMGLGGALFEAVHFDEGRILNPSLLTYRAPRMSDMPEIEVVLVDRPDLPPAGGGETPIIAVAPAIGNAIHAAAGVRLRRLPLAPDGVIALADRPASTARR